eukprot:1034314-Amphidinium_carterae.2
MELMAKWIEEVDFTPSGGVLVTSTSTWEIRRKRWKQCLAFQVVAALLESYSLVVTGKLLKDLPSLCAINDLAASPSIALVEFNHGTSLAPKFHNNSSSELELNVDAIGEAIYTLAHTQGNIEGIEDFHGRPSRSLKTERPTWDIYLSMRGSCAFDLEQCFGSSSLKSTLTSHEFGLDLSLTLAASTVFWKQLLRYFSA